MKKWWIGSVVLALTLSLSASAFSANVFPHQGEDEDVWGTMLRAFFDPYFDLDTGALKPLVFSCADQDITHTIIVTCPPYNAVGDGVADDTAAFVAAVAAAQNKILMIPPSTYRLTSPLTITATTAIQGAGATLLKAHAGRVLVLAKGATHIEGLTIQGVTTEDTTFGTLGSAIYIYNGDTGFYPDTQYIRLTNIRTLSLDLSLEIEADAGANLQVQGYQHKPYTNQSRGIWCKGPDTLAMGRHFSELELSLSYMTLDGTLDTFITNHILMRVETNSTAFGTQISTGRWGNLGLPMTIAGVATMIYGVAFSGDITIPVGASVLLYGASGYAVTNLSSNSQVFMNSLPIETNSPVYVKASTTTYPGLRIPHGAAPTSPANGDIWTTTTGLFVRINGTTHTLAGEGLVAINSSSGLPAAGGTKLYLGGGYGTPVVGRAYIGDGLGWRFEMVKRIASVDTPLMTFYDSGVFATQNLRITTPTVPATAGSVGTTGDVAWDANYVYVCIATNTWKRSALATW